MASLILQPKLRDGGPRMRLQGRLITSENLCLTTALLRETLVAILLLKPRRCSFSWNLSVRYIRNEFEIHSLRLKEHDRFSNA